VHLAGEVLADHLGHQVDERLLVVDDHHGTGRSRSFFLGGFHGGTVDSQPAWRVAGQYATRKALALDQTEMKRWGRPAPAQGQP
jgi:hypothetical protein